LSVIAANAQNGWKRPIYFTTYTNDINELGIASYLRRDGMAYRLVPVSNTTSASGLHLNTDKMLKLLMDEQKWKSGNANIPGVYFDEENRRHLVAMREVHAQLAIDLAQKGRAAEARQILERADKLIPEVNMPYGMSGRYYNDHNKASIGFLQACYLAGATELAKKVSASVKKDLEQQVRFYKSLADDEEKAQNMSREHQYAAEYLKQVMEIDQRYAGKPPVPPGEGTPPITNPK
jgi:tetratricopeptide (TPR) repeat protein